MDDAKQEWAAIQALFDKLVDLDPVEQASLLTKSAEPELVKTKAKAMLAANAQDGILDMMPPSLDDQPQRSDFVSLPSGQTIGSFTVDSFLGRGGMGEVYLAHRSTEDFNQKVAIKLLRVEAADRIELFARERRLLAGLSHPHIARLVDGGVSADGRPYMVMDYIDGEPIDIWVRQHNADLAKRLSLFRDICDAVAYAHANLVVHRDLKPSNIMINRDGSVQLLDFGIAKLLDDNVGVAETTLAMLTPDYASPEQLAGEQVTIATDIYALGALLFQLLTDSTPWQREGASVPVIVRRIMQDDPPLPSKVVARDDAPVSARQISGDLDAIVLKAMRRDPAQRYRGVIELSDDIQRYEELKPVRAREGSTRYMMGRFVRRYRWAVAASVAAIAAILMGAGGVAWQARQTAIERDNAFAEAGRIDAANQAFLDMFQDASDQSRFETTTMREMIDGTKDRLMSSLSPQSPDAADTIGALADLYLTVGSDADAKSLLEGALARGIGRTDPVGRARLKLQLGVAEMRNKNPARARRLLEEVRPIWLADPTRFLREIVVTADVESAILWEEGKRENAISLLIQNMPAAEQANAAYNRDLVWYYQKLTKFLMEMDRPVEADAVISHGLTILKSRNQEKTNAALLLRRFQADIAGLRGDDARAAQMLRSTIADRRTTFGPSLALSVDLLKLGRLLTKTGKPAQALPLLDEAAAMSGKYFGVKSDPSLQMAFARVDALAYLGRAASANAILAEVEPYAREAGVDSLSYGAFLRSRANLRITENRLDHSQADLDRADAIFAAKGSKGDSYKPASAKIRERLIQAQKAKAG